MLPFWFSVNKQLAIPVFALKFKNYTFPFYLEESADTPEKINEYNTMQKILVQIISMETRIDYALSNVFNVCNRPPYFFIKFCIIMGGNPDYIAPLHYYLNDNTVRLMLIANTNFNIPFLTNEPFWELGGFGRSYPNVL